MGFVFVWNRITHPHSFPQDGRMNYYATFVAKESILVFVRTQTIFLSILRGRSEWGCTCLEYNNPSSFLPSGWKDELLCHFRGRGIYSGVRKNISNFSSHFKGKVRMGFVYVWNTITHPHCFPQDGRMNYYATFVAEESILVFVRT